MLLCSAIRGLRPLIHARHDAIRIRASITRSAWQTSIVAKRAIVGVEVDEQ
jgi:hypothetical protein